MREHVDRAGGQARERGLQIHRRELDLGFVTQRGRSDGLAQVDVEALALAGVVLGRKAGGGQRHAAFQHAMRLDVVEHVGARSAGQRHDSSQPKESLACFGKRDLKAHVVGSVFEEGEAACLRRRM